MNFSRKHLGLATFFTTKNRGVSRNYHGRQADPARPNVYGCLAGRFVGRCAAEFEDWHRGSWKARMVGWQLKARGFLRFLGGNLRFVWHQYGISIFISILMVNMMIHHQIEGGYPVNFQTDLILFCSSLRTAELLWSWMSSFARVEISCICWGKKVRNWDKKLGHHLMDSIRSWIHHELVVWQALWEFAFHKMHRNKISMEPKMQFPQKGHLSFQSIFSGFKHCWILFVPKRIGCVHSILCSILWYSLIF